MLSRHWGAGSPWRGHATGRLRGDESLGAGGSTSPPPDLTASPQGSGTRRREGSLPDQQPPRHFCGRGLIGGHTGQRPWGSLRGVWANPAPPAEPGQAHAGGRWALGPASGGPASHTATPRPGGEACPAPGCVPHPAGPRDVTGRPGAGHGDGQPQGKAGDRSPQALHSTGTHLAPGSWGGPDVSPVESSGTLPHLPRPRPALLCPRFRQTQSRLHPRPHSCKASSRRPGSGTASVTLTLRRGLTPQVPMARWGSAFRLRNHSPALDGHGGRNLTAAAPTKARPRGRLVTEAWGSRGGTGFPAEPPCPSAGPGRASLMTCFEAL